MSINTKWPKNIAKLQLKCQNVHEIHNKYAFQGLPKYPKIGIFWYQNKPSGNPGVNRRLRILAIFNFFSSIQILGGAKNKDALF
jgi:hypothetical protein